MPKTNIGIDKVKERIRFVEQNRQTVNKPDYNLSA